VPRLSSSRGAQVADRARIRADRARVQADLAKALARQTAADIAPLAKSAGEAVRQGADDLAAWAGPQVRKSRAWAAPQLERTGVLVQETLAPQVADALTRAAHRLDPEPVPRHRGLRPLLALGLAAAAAAVAVLVIRKNSGSAVSQPAEDRTDEPGSSTGTPEDTASAGSQDQDSRVDANGHIRSTP